MRESAAPALGPSPAEERAVAPSRDLICVDDEIFDRRSAEMACRSKPAELVGKSFTDTDENVTFLTTVVCKCDGEYYFRYVPTFISRSRKAKDYEHTPALELMPERRLVQGAD